ncbi:uncharacterized protein DS421_2g35020 [Arachis hypogaea]|nr:uncharacterized protein DS421_2g35020 [Arachis hypogaea]
MRVYDDSLVYDGCPREIGPSDWSFHENATMDATRAAIPPVAAGHAAESAP